MADINIERKGASIWPWILGLLILAGVVWVVMRYYQADGDTAGVPADSTVVQQPAPQYAPAPAAVPADSVPVSGDSVPPVTTTSQ